MHDLEQYNVLDLLASLETVVTVRGDLPKNVFFWANILLGVLCLLIVLIILH